MSFIRPEKGWLPNFVDFAALRHLGEECSIPTLLGPVPKLPVDVACDGPRRLFGVHPDSARIEGGRIGTIGCELHARQQTLAMLLMPLAS